jgi:hypothetical protein
MLIAVDSRTVDMEFVMDASAKGFVTTHLPKQLALKIDGALVVCRFIAAKT